MPISGVTVKKLQRSTHKRDWIE